MFSGAAARQPRDRTSGALPSTLEASRVPLPDLGAHHRFLLVLRLLHHDRLVANTSELKIIVHVRVPIFLFQDWWDGLLEYRGFPMWLGYLPKIMLAVVISLMDEAYFKIAIWLNDKGKSCHDLSLTLFGSLNKSAFLAQTLQT